MKSLLIIGLGNIGAAIAHGLNALSSQQFHIFGFDTHSEKVKQLEKTTNFKSVLKIDDAVGKADIVLLSVKPYDLAEVAKHIKGKVNKNALVISVLAGKSTADVGEALGFKGGIVRSMPNIAATVGAAATAMCCNIETSAEQKKSTEEIFNAIGESSWTEEDKLDAVTGLSGSGPAYIFMIIESLIDGGVRMGLTRALATRLATQTVLGAAKLVREKGIHPAVLKDQVSTPAGTTVDATFELENRGLRAMLIQAVQLATEKSKKLRESKK